MAAATARARAKPANGKGRTATVRPLTIQISSNADEYSLQEQRAQRLVDKLGLSAARARIFASLAWENVHA